MSVNDIVNFALAGAGAAAGIYGAIRAWLSNKKMKQIEEEKLSSKLNINFNYDLIKSGDTKMCRGVVKWSNLGLTNIKIVRLNIDIRDREDELRESYLPSGNRVNSSFNPYSKKVEKIELMAVNNHKLVNFSNDLKKGEVRIFQDDPIYGLKLSDRQKRELKESGEEVDMDVLKIKRSITQYIDSKIIRLQEVFSSEEKKGSRKNLNLFLFKETLVRELRGIQLFPQEFKDQEFFLKYDGEGIVYLNVENATIRIQLKNINAIEEYKSMGIEIIDAEELSDLLIEKYRKLLKLIISPSAFELHKHKSNYLIYLK